eukprot:366501-Chlamydomonas_euryale.AAC.20
MSHAEDLQRTQHVSRAIPMTGSGELSSSAISALNEAFVSQSLEVESLRVQLAAAHQRDSELVVFKQRVDDLEAALAKQVPPAVQSLASAATHATGIGSTNGAEHTQIAEALTTARSELLDSRKACASALLERDHLESELRQLRLQLADMAAESTNDRAALIATQQECAAAGSRADAAEARALQADDLLARCELLAARLASTRQELDETSAREAALARSKEELEAVLLDARTRLNNSEQQCEATHATLQDLQPKLAELENEKSFAKARLLHTEVLLAEVTKSLAQADTEVNALKKQTEAEDKRMQQVQAQKAETAMALADSRSHAAGIAQEMKALTVRALQAETQLATVQTQLAQSLVDAHDFKHDRDAAAARALQAEVDLAEAQEQVRALIQSREAAMAEAEVAALSAQAARDAEVMAITAAADAGAVAAQLRDELMAHHQGFAQLQADLDKVQQLLQQEQQEHAKTTALSSKLESRNLLALAQLSELTVSAEKRVEETEHASAEVLRVLDELGRMAELSSRMQGRVDSLETEKKNALRSMTEMEAHAVQAAEEKCQIQGQLMSFQQSLEAAQQQLKCVQDDMAEVDADKTNVLRLLEDWDGCLLAATEDSKRMTAELARSRAALENVQEHVVRSKHLEETLKAEKAEVLAQLAQMEVQAQAVSEDNRQTSAKLVTAIQDLQSCQKQQAYLHACLQLARDTSQSLEEDACSSNAVLQEALKNARQQHEETLAHLRRCEVAAQDHEQAQERAAHELEDAQNSIQQLQTEVCNVRGQLQASGVSFDVQLGQAKAMAEELQLKLTKCQVREKEMSSAIVVLEQDKSAAVAQMLASDNAVSGLQKEVNRTRQQLLVRDAEADELLQEKDLVQSQLGEALSQQSELAAKLADFKDLHGVLNAHHTALNAQLETMDMQLTLILQAEANSAAGLREAKENSLQLEAQVVRLQTALCASQQKQDDAAAHQEVQLVELAQTRAQLLGVREHVTLLQSELSRAEATICVLGDEKEAAAKRAANDEAHMSELSTRLAALRCENDSLSDRAGRSEAQLADFRSQLELACLGRDQAVKELQNALAQANSAAAEALAARKAETRAQAEAFDLSKSLADLRSELESVQQSMSDRERTLTRAGNAEAAASALAAQLVILQVGARPQAFLASFVHAFR